MSALRALCTCCLLLALPVGPAEAGSDSRVHVSAALHASASRGGAGATEWPAHLQGSVVYTHHEITPVTSAAPFAPTVLEWSWTVTLHVRLDFRALAGDAAVYDVAEETWDVTGSGSGRAEWDMGDVDLLGCRVRLLHQGPVEAGRRTFALDTVGLPAGPYVVRAIGERFTATAPFVVIR